MAHTAVRAGIALVMLLTGCSRGSVTVLGDGGGSEADRGAETARVDCLGSVYDPDGLATAPSASSLPDGPANATDDAGEPAFDPAQDWKVVHRSEDRVDLVRELDEPFDNGGGDVRTHERRILERITGATNVPDGTWLLTAAGPCIPRLVTDDDLGDADLTLAEEPSPDDTSIDLLVHEWACASGRSAEGRIELLELDATPEQVRVRIGVRAPPGGGQTCQGNPPTPFTVELDEPVGHRQIVDASVVPPRPLSVADGG